MAQYDLQERLIEFSVQIIALLTDIETSKAGKHLAGQIVRSGTSPALNYGEAQSAESTKDFIHKVKIILKELRETYICLMILDRSHLCKNKSVLLSLQKESDELIAIFVKSISTAEKNLKK